MWPHEALDFTPWLAEEDNLSLLSDAVGLEITNDWAKEIKRQTSSSPHTAGEI